MAAYAALVSVMHIIEQIQNHPRPPFYLDNKHAQRLIEKVAFLQDFLEVYSHIHNEEVECLESRIAEAAYAAEDLIETHIVDQIHAQSARHGRRICSADFYQDLQKLIEDMDSIKKEVMEVQTRIGQVRDIQQHTGSPIFPAGSSGSPSMEQNIMLGFDDVSLELKTEIVRKQSNRQVIAIVGMGGMGKTTLAKSVYGNQLIVEYFDICAWATISQEYSVRKILLELLLCQKNQASRESLSKQSDEDLRDRLHKSLFGRRYLIILDDMWSIQAWDKVKSLFPENNNGSRVIVTTRQSNIASDLTSGRHGSIIEMDFLNDDISWELLSKVVFGSKDRCPFQLEETGKKVAKSCKGLPLAIVVIGGLLAKSEKTAKYWEYIAKNLHSLEENEHCLNLLCTSYNHLPVHLKPCFLYMGVSNEDSEIYVPGLIRLWVVEGFLKPIRGKSLEEVAAQYFKDLVGRNLILVEKRDHNGEAELCKIHDLLRDLCLRESQKDKFLIVIRQHVLNNSLPGINTQRRISIQVRRSEEENQHNFLQICDALHSASLARTLIWNILDENISSGRTEWKLSPSPNNRLLRVFSIFGSSYGDDDSVNSISQLVNLRCIMITETGCLRLPPLTNLFWNLQTIVISATELLSFEIWKMPLLRCVLVDVIHLTNPGEDDFVLENLHTLRNVYGFTCSEKVVKRIPNIKALEFFYEKRFFVSRYCLNNLTRLHKLERIACKFYGQMPSRTELLQNLTFPHSLQELMLEGCYLQWEDISTKIGLLPLLQVLKLEMHSFGGCEWETIEGQFCSLKILKISDCEYLRWWKTESSHFPCLEELDLERVPRLEEIPSSIGDIHTMRSIQLWQCSESANNSALNIAEEQKELYNHDLHVRVSHYFSNAGSMKWARPYYARWTLVR